MFCVDKSAKLCHSLSMSADSNSPIERSGNQPAGKDIVELKPKGQRQNLPIPNSSAAIAEPGKDRRDAFSKTLEMMQRNGTDEQTRRVYANILEVVRLNMHAFDAKAKGLAQGFAQYLPLEQWEKPRVEIPGMPVINIDHPAHPFFSLEPNYHNGSEWIATVCIDDPTIVNEHGIIQYHKPNGEQNRARSVQIVPGDETHPGNMYSHVPGKEGWLLTTALRQRIDDAFQAAIDLSKTPKTTRLFINSYIEVDEIPFDVLSQYQDRDGGSLGDEYKKIKSEKFYELILGGEIIKKPPST